MKDISGLHIAGIRRDHDARVPEQSAATIDDMSGLEVVAVLGAVAGVISAYKDASRIVKDFKDKRRAKKADELERSLLRGPLAVQEARNHGVERFGQAFADGDRTGVLHHHPRNTG